MAPDLQLGKLERVTIREVWNDEARNFTPWIAGEGVSLLGDALGRELRIVSCEHKVGRYSLDILATEVGSEEGAESDHLIVIENQFGSTNHDHLGKLLTYASGVGDDNQGAKTIIWIAEDFHEEHRRALDWLNDVTNSDIRFYGVQIELYRIGESMPAPSLNVIVRPNEVVRARRSISSSASMSEAVLEKNLFYVEYWTAFKDYCVNHGAVFTLQTPRPQHWIASALGSANYHLSFVATRRDEWVGVELIIRGSAPGEILAKLSAEKEEINRLINNSVSPEWAVISPKLCKISVSMNWPPSDRTQWPTQHQWLYETGQKFYTVFTAKLKALKG